MLAPKATTAAAVLIAGLAAGPAQAKPVKDLWATVNVCDTPHSPNQLGVRARMPGDGTHERMYMRFTAQYLSGKTWKPVAQGGRSQWLYAGSALFVNQEIGYTFSFDAPGAGRGFRLRGLTQFQWRDRRRHLGKLRTVVVRRSHRYTAGGHPTRGAEPAGFSAANCRVSTPKA
jgi:hypothetical protein